MNSSYQYDAFISYRRQEPDKTFARDLREFLIADGYKVAFDEVDFSPQASFLGEMERCVRGSRFILAVISSQYLESDNTQEEAIITKVMDMADRKRRLIPLIIEPGERPVWLYTLVGVNFTDHEPLMLPLDRLKAAMGEPQLGPEISPGPPKPKEKRKFIPFLIVFFGVLIFAFGLVFLYFLVFATGNNEEETDQPYSKDSQKENRLIGSRAVASISNLRDIETSKTIAVANLWEIEIWEVREIEGKYVFEEKLENKPIPLKTSNGENLIDIDLTFHPEAPNTLFYIVSGISKSFIEKYNVLSETTDSSGCIFDEEKSKHRIYSDSDISGKYLAVTNSIEQFSLHIFNIDNGKGVDVNGSRCDSYKWFEEASHASALGELDPWEISDLQFFDEGDEDAFIITGHENGDILKWKLGSEASEELVLSEYFEGEGEGGSLDSISYSSKNGFLVASFQTSGQNALIKIWKNPFDNNSNKDGFLAIPSSLSSFAKELTISFNHDKDALILVGEKNDGQYVIEVWPFSQVDSIMKDEMHNIVYCNQEILDDYDSLNAVKFIFGETNSDQLVVTSGQLDNSEYAIDIWSAEVLTCDD